MAINPFLLASPDFTATLAPTKTVQPSAEAYVLSIANLSFYYATAASAPTNVINIFDKTTLQCISTLSAHTPGTTTSKAANYVAGASGLTLVSCGKDGLVKFWDLRSGAEAITLTSGRPLLSCDVSPNGWSVAAGSELQGNDAPILYWDVRSPSSVSRIHNSTHSDDVTAVLFAVPEAGIPRNLLLSASSDGLISISNVDESDEDEAVLHVGNWGCSFAQAGWIMGPRTPEIWASSDMETFSTWTRELDQCQSLNIRVPVLHGSTTWVTDYLITSVMTSQVPSDLGVFVGSNEGDIALLSNSDLLNNDAPWHIHHIWSSGHVGIVRSVLWDPENNVLLSGGEDGKLNVWPKVTDRMDMDVESPSRKRSLNLDDEQVGKRVRR